MLHFDPAQASPNTCGAMITQCIGIYIDPHEMWHHLRTIVLLSCICYSPIWFIPKSCSSVVHYSISKLEIGLKSFTPIFTFNPSRTDFIKLCVNSHKARHFKRNERIKKQMMAGDGEQMKPKSTSKSLPDPSGLPALVYRLISCSGAKIYSDSSTGMNLIY